MPDPTWDLTDQDCDAFDLGWSAVTGGSAAATLVTEDGRSCWKLNNPGGASDSVYVNNTSIDWNSNLTYEIVAKYAVDVNNNNYTVAFYCRDADIIESALRYVIDTVGFTYPFGDVSYWDGSATQIKRGYIDISTSTWHTFRFVVSADNATGWVDGKLVYFSFGPAQIRSTKTANTLGIQLFSDPSITTTLYVDHVRASSTPEEPNSNSSLKVQGLNIMSRIRQRVSPPTDWISASPFNFYKNNCSFSPSLVYEVPVVVTTDTNASSVRIYSGGLVKSLMKEPLF